jgi:DNA polymerase-3 subunit alpha
LERYSTATTRQAKNLAEGMDVTVGGMINRVKRAITKTGRSAGQPMCIVTLEDLDGQIEATMFAETLAEITKRNPQSIAAEQIVFIRGKVDKRRETPGIIVNDVIPISEAMPRLTRGVKVELDRLEGAQETLGRLKSILNKHKGNCQTYLSLPANGTGRVLIVLDEQWRLRATSEMKKELEFVLNGQGRVELAGDGTRRAKQLQQPLFQNAEISETPLDSAVAASMADEEEL